MADGVIGCAFDAINMLGCGFLEKIHENALAHDLHKAVLRLVQQHGGTARYDDIIGGKCIADLLPEHAVAVELKNLKTLDNMYTARCINFLKGAPQPLVWRRVRWLR
jgi:GxxExxY protein